MEIKVISHKSLSIRSFTDEIHSLLTPADARKSADISYLICASLAQLLTAKIRYFDNLVVAYFLGHPVCNTSENGIILIETLIKWRIYWIKDFFREFSF